MLSLILLGIAPFNSRRVATPTWITQLRDLRGGQVTVAPDQGHVSLVKAIQMAQSSIWMEIYHLTDPEIIAELINAKKRNVQVVVILDNKSIENPKYKTIYDQLSQAGVLAYKSSAQFSITHAKSFLIDKKLLFISTMNFVGHFQNMRDVGVFTVEPGLIQAWTQVFLADIDNAKNNTANTPPVAHPNIIVSPFNSEAKIVDLINFANTSIQTTTENLGIDSVVNALTAAAQRGVKVFVIAPECDLNPNPLFNYPALYKLAKAGAQVKIMADPSTPTSPYMHEKSMVVDGKLAFLGSENFSINSLRQAREIGVVFTSTDLVSAVAKIFNTDWTRAITLPPQPPTTCKPIGAEGGPSSSNLEE